MICRLLPLLIPVLLSVDLLEGKMPPPLPPHPATPPKPPMQMAQGDQFMLDTIQRQNALLRFTATEEQAQVAREKAETYYTRLPPAKKAELKKRKIRYLAVPTVRSKDTPASAKAVIMIWDIPRETLASKQVYETENPLPAGKLASFDNMEAEYIGGETTQ
jgi:hypothetical protein